MEDLYKNCRWCHWFNEGQCFHDKTFKGSSMDIQYFLEEVVISEVIKEGFTEQAFRQLKNNLESKLSKKKANEFMQAFYEELEAAKINWTETIDETITKALKNAVGEDQTAKIIDPEEFCCRYFM